MRTRKSTTLFLLAGGLLIIGMLAFSQSHHSPQAQRHSAAKQVSYAASVERGIAYEKTRIHTMPPYERLMFDYLQRKYAIDKVFSAAHTPIPTPAKGQGVDPKQFNALLRIAYPNDLVDAIPDAADDTMSQMVMEAANCDHIPLPDDFGSLVNQNIQAGKYFLTHVALALRFMDDNGCTYFSSEQESQIRQSVTAGMKELAGNMTTKADLRYEATAFLLDTNLGQAVSDAWIRQTVTEQLPSGGWSESVGGTAANDHTTLLAIWALLGVTHPTAPNEPMIRRPN